MRFQYDIIYISHLFGYVAICYRSRHIAAVAVYCGTEIKKQKILQTKKKKRKKLKSLQSKVGNMRFTTTYAKMATEVSDDNVVSVITGENAVAGVLDTVVKILACATAMPTFTAVLVTALSLLEQ